MASMLTTTDNPHDPRSHFNAWYLWDVEHGYNTCGYLARVAGLAEAFPQDFIDRQIEMAIDEIIKEHAGGLYKKLEVPNRDESSINVNVRT